MLHPLRSSRYADHGIKRHPPRYAKRSVDGLVVSYSQRGSFGAKVLLASGLTGLLLGLFFRFDPFFGLKILSPLEWVFLVIGALLTTASVIHSRATDELTIDLRRRYVTWSRTSIFGVQTRESELDTGQLRVHPCRLARLAHRRSPAMIPLYWHGFALCFCVDRVVWMVLAVDRTPEACLTALRFESLDLTPLLQGTGPKITGLYLGSMY